VPDPLWLGATLRDANDKLEFASVINDGPAEAAGVVPGDVAVALDGLAFTAGNFDRRLQSYRDGDVLELVIFRGDELITTEITLERAPEDTWYLQIDATASAEQVARRKDWLHPN
jgi:predicted metalloprotease with PDZ domain